MINYYLLMKPGIILGNLITFAAGFLLASQGEIQGWLFLKALLGLSCIIASACVFNNYIDRHVDQKMDRTRRRALASGTVKGRHALLFATALGLLGNGILLTGTNLATVLVANAGFLIYVAIYSFIKSHTPYSTLIGSFSGAVPPVVGYCAVSGSLDAAAAVLFLIMVLWQMPHFFAIGLWRYNDYVKAGIPILPVSAGAYKTKVHMILYIAGLLTILTVLALSGHTGNIFLLATATVGLGWLFYGLKGFKAENDSLWGRHMFRLSLLMINVMSICSIVDR